jgi:hypothetical protein
MLNHKGQSSKKSSTPRNIILHNSPQDQPEGGTYKCTALFGDNLSYLSYEQAEFIVTLENWTPEKEIVKNIQGKAELVDAFRTDFLSLNKPLDGISERIKMMNIKEKEKDTLCWKPSK